MTVDHSRVRIREAGLGDKDGAAVAAAVGDYLLQTELEKAEHGLSSPISGVRELPARYLQEIENPEHAYHACRVQVAELGEDVVGVVVVKPDDGFSEIKRLWARPQVRGRGVGSALLDAAIDASNVPVRLSVWEWRVNAIRLYTSRGFERVPSWDSRDRLICMLRP